jgi:hypothetical protein
MSYFYDEELPNGFQDADFEMRELEEEAAHIHALNKAGICTHNSWVGLPASGEVFYPAQEGLKPGQVRCTDLCKALFDTEDELLDDSRAVRN